MFLDPCVVTQMTTKSSKAFDVYHKDTIPHNHTAFNLYVAVQILSVLSIYWINDESK